MITSQLCMNTRKVVLNFIFDSHLRNISSRFRVESTVKKYWKTIPSEQTTYNLVSSSLHLK